MDTNHPPKSIAPQTQTTSNGSLSPQATSPSARPPISIHDRVTWRPLRKTLVTLGFIGFGAAAAGSAQAAHSARAAFATATPRKVDDGKSERWGAGNVSVVLDGSLDDLDPNAKDAVSAAFGEWITSGAKVNAVVVNRSTDHIGVAHDGVNRIVYGPITISGHEKDVAATISYANDATGEIEEADTVFNSAYPFAVLPEGSVDSKTCAGKAYDVQNVATHELGHFFGLGEDFSDTSTVMFIQSAPCQTHKRLLTESDTVAMSGLYATAPAPGSSAPSGAAASCAVSRAGGAADFSGVFFFAVALGALMIRRGTYIRTCP
ncbi:MAG: matrixin family metalloprotease [Polyangiaceae bacterium]